MKPKEWLSVALISLAAVVVSIDVAMLQQGEYRSSMSVLVIEKNASLDAYAAAKSAERLSTSLANIVYTTSFMSAVLVADGTPANVLTSVASEDQRNEWKHMIETRVLTDIGTLNISVYHPDRQTVSELATSLGSVLVDQGSAYLGGGNTIVLRVVNPASTTDHTVRPDLLLAAIGGLLLGVLGSVGYMCIRVTGRFGERTRRLPDGVSVRPGE